MPVRWSCRTGVCHNCETGLISGSVIYRPDPVEPPAAGNLLICCSQPQVTLLSIFDAVEAAPRARPVHKRYKQLAAARDRHKDATSRKARNGCYDKYRSLPQTEDGHKM